MGFRKVIIFFAFLILPVSSIAFYIYQQKEVTIIVYSMTSISCLLAIFFVSSRFRFAYVLGRVLVSIYAIDALYNTITEHSISLDLLFSLLATLINIAIVSLIYFFFVEYSATSNQAQRQ